MNGGGVWANFQGPEAGKPALDAKAKDNTIIDFEPFSHGFGLMRDAQTTKPQSFRTGGEWFVYNLATNLAQVS